MPDECTGLLLFNNSRVSIITHQDQGLNSLLETGAHKEPQCLSCMLGRQHTGTLRELPTPFNFRLNFVRLLSVFSR